MLRIHDEGYACDLRREFWAEKKFDVEWVTGDTEDVIAAKTADVILVDPLYSDVYLQKKLRMSRELKQLGFTDHLALTDGVYWPGAYSQTAFRKMIIGHARTLNLSVRAYVTGTSPWARLAILGAFDVGYRQVRIIGVDEAEAQKIIEDFSKFCFGLALELQDRSQLTLQPNNGSLLINTEALTKDPDLLEILMYLNFINRDGVIADLEFQADDGALCREAQASGFKCLSGIDFRGAVDFEVLSSKGLLPVSAAEAYLKDWAAFLKRSAPTDKMEKPAIDPVPNS